MEFASNAYINRLSGHFSCAMSFHPVLCAEGRFFSEMTFFNAFILFSLTAVPENVSLVGNLSGRG